MSACMLATDIVCMYMYMYWLLCQSLVQYQSLDDSDVVDFVHVSSFSHVLLLLVKVSLVMLLCYGLYVDMPLPLSQLVSLGNNSEQY